MRLFARKVQGNSSRLEMTFSGFVKLSVFGLGSALMVVACGGSDKPAKTPYEEVTLEEEEPEGSGVAVSSEIGGLNQEQVDAVFARSVDDLQECLSSGADRVEFLGGGVSFFLKINADGRVTHAHLEASTLGDRETEKCMLTALRNETWPKPVGGQTGLARKSFDFDPPNDVRPPTIWSSEELDEAIGELTPDLNGCKRGTHDEFAVTMYVGTDGSVLAAGVAHEEESGEGAADCLVETLMSATFPSPGSWPAKVSVRL